MSRWRRAADPSSRPLPLLRLAITLARDQIGAAEVQGRDLCYQVVLTRSGRYVLARVEELDLEVPGRSVSDALWVARQRALRVLARYEEEGWSIPPPVEKMLATIELPVPSPPPAPAAADGGHGSWPPVGAIGDGWAGGHVVEYLTPRQRQVLAYLRLGQSHAEIAHALGIGVETVRTHAKHVRRKLGVRRKSELVGLQIPSQTPFEIR